jgi:MFS family permease
MHSRSILAALSLMMITNIYTTVSTNFWGVLFTGKLGFAEAQISIYVALRSIVMTAGFFLIGPRLTNLRRFRLPLWMGFSAFLLSQLLLVVMPPQAVLLLVVSVVLEGVAAALVSPMTESLLALSMESKERARVSAMVYLALIVHLPIWLDRRPALRARPLSPVCSEYGVIWDRHRPRLAVWQSGISQRRGPTCRRTICPVPIGLLCLK